MSDELVEVLGDIRDELKRIADQMEDRAETEWKRTPEGLPICPKHDEAMTQREKQGDTWYSHSVMDPNTGEKLYCRGYASKNSPGWWVNPIEETPPARPVLRPTQPRPPLSTQAARPPQPANKARPLPPAYTCQQANEELFP